MATSTRERREEYSSNVVRTLSPTRPLSPGSNLSAEADAKLDYLLEDLQSTVSGGSPRLIDSSFTSTGRDMQYLAPSNSTTVIRERSKSPTGASERVYKTANYSYGTSFGPTTTAASYNSQNNVSQLDALLQDLKTERESRDRDYGHPRDLSLDLGTIEPGGTVTKTTKYYSSSGSSGAKPTVQRELIFDGPNTSVYKTTKTRSDPKSSSYVKKVETKTVKDMSYEPDVELVKTSTLNRYNYSDSSTRERNVTPYATTNKTVTVDSTDFPDDLKKIPLSDDILPSPGTKVTTTVRTYTYEIPPDSTNTAKTLLYKNEQFNSSNTSTSYAPPPREIPSTVVYKTESYNTINSRDGYPPSREPSASPIPGTTSRTIYRKEDTRETTSTSLSPGGRPRAVSPQPGPTSTIIYKEDIRNTNINQYPPGPRPRAASPQPGPNSTIIYKEDIRNTNVNQYPPNNYPPGQPRGPTQTYYYKHESTNTKNTMYGPPGGDKPHSPSPLITYPSDTRSPPPPRSPQYPNEPGSVTYKYSERTTTNTTRGGEREPLIQPAPFPVDGLEPVYGTDVPPKRLDDLMASLGNVPNGRGPVDEPYVARREVDTSVATAKSTAIVPSKNVAGPPVYYPPGHEMFARKEESGAAYRAGGGWARAAGKYEYESESKSKSKSKSGATMIPVCLPLCCAMPCSIM